MPYVYILASISRILYVGSTENIQQRVLDHRAGRGAAFTKKYRVNRLVYFESVESLSVASRRELELKAWRREKKIALIESMNPEWQDLVAPASDVSSWGEESGTPLRRAPGRPREGVSGRGSIRAHPGAEEVKRARFLEQGEPDLAEIVVSLDGASALLAKGRTGISMDVLIG